MIQNGIEVDATSKTWRRDWKPHREDGPAIEWFEGTREWRIDGRHHREGGPAIEYSDGRREWYEAGKRINKKDFKSLADVERFNAWELFSAVEIARLARA